MQLYVARAGWWGAWRSCPGVTLDLAFGDVWGILGLGDSGSLINSKLLYSFAAAFSFFLTWW